ncbi:WAT1-related protein At4g08300-like isoform X2 [Daucus carota subsp. sativus]|uniref:WAT1-related protein At4g08300-like isoform X2 n=1 Tax=Daucus carota subsp. sativus TaxID=79200 RepID=UPI003083857F
MVAEFSRPGGMYERFKPHLLMVLAQLGYTFLYLITEASFAHGMNPHVYITYRHVVAALFILPFAYFLERKTRPKLTLYLFMEIFVLSLLGVSLTLNMYFASLNYTSPTFLASIVNVIASMTFVMAVVLRLEEVNLRELRGIAKILGTLISLAGVLTMTLYKGSTLRNIGRPIIHFKRSAAEQEDWLKGSILTVTSCLTWSIWYIMQGIVVSGLIIYIQLWCMEERGPVFVTMFNPLSTIIVAVLAYFALDEKLYMGSIIGSVVVIMGLYLLLWGKEADQRMQLLPKGKPEDTYSDEHCPRDGELNLGMKEEA